MDPNANSGANGATDTSSVTAIKVQVILDTTTAQLKQQFAGIQNDIEKDPIGLTFGVDKKTSKDAIIKGLQEILGNGTNITIGAGVDPNAGNKVKNQVKNATDAGQQVADKNKVKIKVQTDVDTDTKDKIRAYYKRVQQQVNQSIKIARLKKTNPNSKEYHDAVDIYREQKRDAAKLRSELGDKIPTYTRSANDYSKEAEIRRAGRFRVRDSLSSLEASQQRVAENTAKKNAKAVVDAEFNAKKSALFERAKEIGKARTQLETLERGTPAYNNAVKNLRDSKTGYAALRHELGDKVSTEEYSRLSEIFRQNDRDVQNARANALTKAIEAANKNVVHSIANNAQEKLKTFYEQQRKAGTLEQASLTLANKNADSEELKAVSEQLERTKSVASALRDELSDLLPEEEIHKLTKLDQELEDSLTRIKGRIADQNVAKTQSETDARLAAVKKAKISEYNSELSDFKKLTLDSARLEGKGNSENELSFVNQQMEDSLNNLNKLQTDLGDVLSKNELDEIIHQYEKFESDLADEVTRIEAHYEDLKNVRESTKATAEEKRQVKQTDDYTNSLATARNKYKDMSGVPSDVSDSLDNVDAQIKKLDTLKVGTQDYAEQLKVIGTVWADATRQMSAFDEAQKKAENNVKSMTEQALKWKESIKDSNTASQELRDSIDGIIDASKKLDSDHSSDAYKKGVKDLDDAFISTKASMSVYTDGYKDLESTATKTLTEIRKKQLELQQAGNHKFDNALTGDSQSASLDGSLESQFNYLKRYNSQSADYKQILEGIVEEWKKIKIEIDQALKSEEDLEKEADKRKKKLDDLADSIQSIENQSRGAGNTLNTELKKYVYGEKWQKDGDQQDGILKGLREKLNTLSGTTDVSEYKRLLQELEAEIDTAGQKITDFKKRFQESGAYERERKNLNNLVLQIDKYAASLSGLDKRKDLAEELNNIRQASVDGTSTYSTLSNLLSNLQIRMEQAGISAETLGQKLSRLFKEHLQTAIAMAGVAMVKQGLREVYDNVVDIDTSMTNLKKVTNETESAYSSFLSSASSQARELGASISDVIDSTAEWSRLGYTLDESQELAKWSTVLSNIGDGIDSASDAASYLVSILKGFRMEADEVDHVVNVLNSVGNNEPISESGIAEALVRSASALSAAGNSFEQSVSLITAANSVLQDPDTVGTTVRTISMYLRAAKTDLTNLGESVDGCADSVSSLRTEMKQLTGVDIMKDAAGTQFKSTYEILKEISEVWDKLTDVSKANVTNLLGGKRNANAVSALLSQFSIAEKSMEDAANSSNSAMAEQERMMDSIEGRLKQLNASFEKFSNDVMGSDLIKFFVTLATKIVDAADGMVNLTGSIPAITAAISGVLSVMQMSGKLKNGAGKVNMPSYICCV